VYKHPALNPEKSHMSACSHDDPEMTPDRCDAQTAGLFFFDVWRPCYTTVCCFSG